MVRAGNLESRDLDSISFVTSSLCVLDKSLHQRGNQSTEMGGDIV